MFAKAEPGAEDLIFQGLVEKVRVLISNEFTLPGYFISSGHLYATTPDLYQVLSDFKGQGSAQIKLVNSVDPTKLNARFFLQEITQHDTYYSIKHWHSMQQTPLKDEVKFGALLRVLKQWRDQ